MLHDAFERCVAAGMPSTITASLDEAIPAFIQSAQNHAQANPAQWVFTAAMSQTLPAIPGGFATLPSECEWFTSIDFSMAMSAARSPLALAAIISVLPGWSSHLSRATPAF